MKIQLPKNLSKVKRDNNEIKIVYFGTPEFSAYILEGLISHPWGVTFQTVITRADKPIERDQTVSSSPVTKVAQKYNIPILKPLKLNEEFIQNHLSLLECDLFVVAAYGKIIPQSLLDIPRLGAVNVHGSILPKYRGASPIQAAILNGDKSTGITIMLIDAEMDHGPILSTNEFKLSEKETFASLSKKMSYEGSKLLIKTLQNFVKGKIKPRQQNHKKAVYVKMIKKEDGYFDINSPPPAEVLDRMIRAYYPWPGVWTKWSSKIVKFYPEGKIQMEGKKVISFKDFLNGYPDFPIKNLAASVV